MQSRYLGGWDSVLGSPGSRLARQRKDFALPEFVLASQGSDLLIAESSLVEGAFNLGNTGTSLLDSRSIRIDAEKLEDAFEFGVAEEGNFQRAFALGVAEMDFGAEPVAQTIFEAGDVRVLREREFGAGLFVRPVSLQLGDESFGLADVQAVFDDALGGEVLLLLSGQPEDDFGVTDGEAAVAQITLEGRREFEETERIGNDGTAFADFDGDLFLGELKLGNELRVTLGFFEGIEVFALQVFDQGEFEDGAVVGDAEDDRDFRQTEKLGRAPAAFAGDEFQMVALVADDERLDDALFLDGIGEFAEGFGRKIFARLERAGADAVERHALDVLAVVHHRSENGCSECDRRKGGWRWTADGRRATEKRAETPAQCWFCHAARVSQGRGRCQCEA